MIELVMIMVAVMNMIVSLINKNIVAFMWQFNTIVWVIIAMYRRKRYEIY